MPASTSPRNTAAGTRGKGVGTWTSPSASGNSARVSATWSGDSRSMATRREAVVAAPLRRTTASRPGP